MMNFYGFFVLCCVLYLSLLSQVECIKCALPEEVREVGQLCITEVGLDEPGLFNPEATARERQVVDKMFALFYACLFYKSGVLDENFILIKDTHYKWSVDKLNVTDDTIISRIRMGFDDCYSTYHFLKNETQATLSCTAKVVYDECDGTPK